MARTTINGGIIIHKKIKDYGERTVAHIFMHDEERYAHSESEINLLCYDVTSARLFLVADMRLYKRLCLSVIHESKSGKRAF